MIKEFKEFAFKGNALDMAVGFILGAGFSTIVKSFVTNIIMPPLGLITSGINFNTLSLTLKAAEGDKPAVEIKYGLFIDELIAFMLVAFVVFIIVQKLLAAKKEQPAEAPAAPPKQEVLLEGILEELKKRGN